MSDLSLLEMWAFFGGLILLLLVVNGAYVWWKYRRYPPLPAPEGFSVALSNGGRAGYVEYREGEESCRFVWELGGGDLVAYVAVPRQEQWGGEVSWAAGRREEILVRVAEEVWRQRCRGCRWVIGADSIDFYPGGE